MTNMATQFNFNTKVMQDARLFHHKDIVEYFTEEIYTLVKTLGDPESLNSIARTQYKNDLTSLVNHCLSLTGKNLQEYTENLVHEQRNTSFGI